MDNGLLLPLEDQELPPRIREALLEIKRATYRPNSDLPSADIRTYMVVALTRLGYMWSLAHRDRDSYSLGEIVAWLVLGVLGSRDLLALVIMAYYGRVIQQNVVPSPSEPRRW